MNNAERMRRLLGAVLSECSSAGMEGVKLHVLRAMNALDSETRKKTTVEKSAAEGVRTAVPMTKEQRELALDRIQRAIDEENSRTKKSEVDGETIFG